MARRKKKEDRSGQVILALKIFGVFALAFLLSLGLYYTGRNFAFESEYFLITSIEIDDTLAFIQKSYLDNLKGKNIFQVDIQEAQRLLSSRYPQASELRIVKKFPNQIRIVAKQRMPFAQTKFNDKILTLDEEAIVLSTTSKEDKSLPLIEGLEDTNQGGITLGLPLRDSKAKAALKVVKAFSENVQSTNYKISSINVESLSQIYFYLKADLKIIVDRDRLERKMKILNIVLTEGQVDLSEVKYVDLRFKEPILGKK